MKTRSSSVATNRTAQIQASAKPKYRVRFESANTSNFAVLRDRLTNRRRRLLSLCGREYRSRANGIAAFLAVKQVLRCSV